MAAAATGNLAAPLIVTPLSPRAFHRETPIEHVVAYLAGRMGWTSGRATQIQNNLQDNVESLLLSSLCLFFLTCVLISRSSLPTYDP